MMDYELFKKLIAQRIKEFLPPVFHDYEVQLHAVPKVNGVKEAFCLLPPDRKSNVAVPTLYMDDIYADFAEDEDMDRVLATIAGIFLKWSGVEVPELADFTPQEHTDRIIACLVSTSRNEELLQHVPSLPFLDMSIIYRLAFSITEDGLNSAIITDDMIAGTDLTIEKIHQCAMENTPRLLPMRLFEGPEEGVYIVTNRIEIGGAAVMLCREEMQRLAQKIGGDFFIVPTSMHEFFAIAVDHSTPISLLRMLMDGNENITHLKDQLSDTIYRYSTEREEIAVVIGCEAAEQAPVLQ